VLNFGASCKKHFGMDELFSSFWHRFDGLDEITPCHDYLNVLCKICRKQFYGGFSLRGFHTGILHTNSKLKWSWFLARFISNVFVVESSFGDFA
jgi:hypothetical protein